MTAIGTSLGPISADGQANASVMVPTSRASPTATPMTRPTGVFAAAVGVEESVMMVSNHP
jgi:hypothetical protein